jgi:hypothetical protein
MAEPRRNRRFSVTPRIEHRALTASLALLAVPMLVAACFPVAHEEAASATVPPSQEAAVSAPPAPTPFPTVPPGTQVTWERGIKRLLNRRCVDCHGGGEMLGELDLRTLEGALAGGASGPAVVPGEGHSSLLITRQAGGDHPGQLTPAELALVLHWIELGAPLE